MSSHDGCLAGAWFQSKLKLRIAVVCLAGCLRNVLYGVTPLKWNVCHTAIADSRVSAARAPLAVLSLTLLVG
jgi:hypothetical protein